MSGNTLLQLDLPGVSKVRSGKVREMFDLGDRLLMVASDRISAYDVVMPNGIPLKGEVLTMFSHFWFANSATSSRTIFSPGPTSRCPRPSATTPSKSAAAPWS